MVNLFPDFRDFLELLNSEKAEYLVIGGYAVVHHGYERTTGDLDVWIAANSENVQRVSQALQKFFGYTAEEFRSDRFREADSIFIFGRKPVRIDILTGPPGVEFRECYERRQIVNWDGVSVPLIALSDLKANKLASGRPKDLADVVNLPQDSPRKPKRKRKPK
jgi:hypothetical protein